MTEDEMSLKDIINFFFETWKTILTFGVLGLVTSVVFLSLASNQYEITAQIQMAQINSSNSVEDPNLLLTRMKLPSSYSAENFKACGLGNSKSPAEDLASLAKFSAVKGVSTIVELKIQIESKDEGVACAKSLVENIRSSQNNIIEPYIEQTKSLLAKYQARIEDAKMIVERSDKSGAALSAAYLSTRDEVKFLTDEIIRLNTFITASHAGQTRLVSPIYVSNAPIFPKKKLSLGLGLMAGLFLGLVIASIRKAIAGYRMN